MDSQVVKGSVTFPSRSIRSMNPTNSISPKLEGQVSAGQSLSPTSQASQQDPNSPLQKPVFTEFDSMLPSKAMSRQNSISILSSYKGKLLEISERKKLNEFNTFYNRVVELVCTQNGSKNLQVYSYSHFYIYRLILILLCLILYVKLLLIRLFKKLNLLVVRSFVILLVIISIKFLFFISIHLLASL